GDAWEQTHFHWTVPIENRSHRTIQIDRLVVSCNCLATDPAGLTLSPGEKGTIILTVDLTQNSATQPSPQVRPFQTSFKAAVQPQSGQPVLSERWKLSGRVRPVLAASKWRVEFGKHSDRAQPLGTHCVKITTLATIRAIVA